MVLPFSGVFRQHATLEQVQGRGDRAGATTRAHVFQGERGIQPAVSGLPGARHAGPWCTRVDPHSGPVARALRSRAAHRVLKCGRSSVGACDRSDEASWRSESRWAPGRSRLIQAMLVESFLLASLGAVAGSLLAVWLVPMLSVVTLPNQQPIQLSIEPDLMLYVYGIGSRPGQRTIVRDCSRPEGKPRQRRCRRAARR